MREDGVRHTTSGGTQTVMLKRLSRYEFVRLGRAALVAATNNIELKVIASGTMTI